MKEYRPRSYKVGTHDINPYFDEILRKYGKNITKCEISEDELKFIRNEERSIKDADYFISPPEKCQTSEIFLKNQHKKFFIEYRKLPESKRKLMYRSSTNLFVRTTSTTLVELASFWRLGRYTNIELIAIKYAVYKFLHKNNLSLTQFQEEIVKQMTTNVIMKLSQYIFTLLPLRMLRSIVFTLIQHFHPGRFLPLTKEQEIQILALQKVYGINWASISVEMRQTLNRIMIFLQNEEEKHRKARISIVKDKTCDDDIEESLILREYRQIGSFQSIARKYNVKVSFVRSYILKTFSEVVLLQWNNECDFIIALLVLKYNFFCAFQNSTELIDILEQCVNEYQILQIPSNQNDKNTLSKNNTIFETENMVNQQERTPYQIKNDHDIKNHNQELQNVKVIANKKKTTKEVTNINSSNLHKKPLGRGKEPKDIYFSEHKDIQKDKYCLDNQHYTQKGDYSLYGHNLKVRKTNSEEAKGSSINHIHLKEPLSENKADVLETDKMSLINIQLIEKLDKESEKNSVSSNRLLTCLVNENFKVFDRIKTFFISNIDTNILIDERSIFWRSVVTHFPFYIQIPNTESKILISKFKLLCNTHDIKRYSELIDWIKDYAFESVLDRVKEAISQQNRSE